MTTISVTTVLAALALALCFGFVLAGLCAICAAVNASRISERLREMGYSDGWNEDKD